MDRGHRPVEAAEGEPRRRELGPGVRVQVIAPEVRELSRSVLRISPAENGDAEAPEKSERKRA